MILINTLTTDVLVKLIIKILLLTPLVVAPPNNTAVLLVIDVRVKSSIGGGLSPLTVGVIHSPKQTLIHTHTVNSDIPYKGYISIGGIFHRDKIP